MSQTEHSSSAESGSGSLFRTCILVGIALVAGALLQWGPKEPSVWRWIPFGFAYLVGGWPIAKDTWETLREGRLSIDFLMGAAALGAAAVGEAFEGTVLIFLFSLSNALEERALGRTRREMEALVKLRPDEATLLGPNGEETGRVPVEQLSPGNRIRVRPGERIAVDGKVVDGGGEVDQSAITGESVPVWKEKGSEVFAATVLSGGSLIVEMSRAPHETLLARIIALVEEARAQRAPVQRFIDRFAHPYTLGVIAVTALYWLLPPLFFGRDWSDSFYDAMTLLVVASPCALVISTPAAILSGIANGARNGILFKGGAVLDRAARIDTIAFDKTGTLTEGRPRLLDRVALKNGESGDSAERDLLRKAASLEIGSEHHLARAVVAVAEAEGLVLEPAADFKAIPGKGVSGRVGGETVWVGNDMMARGMGAKVDPVLRGWMAEGTSQGRSVVYVGVEQEAIGALAFGDRLKPDAAAAIRHLKYEGIRWIAILSGDHPDAVRSVAAELGADEVRAGLLPDEKVKYVRELEARSRGVAMVGDGVNDAPAMAAASLGIAMGAAGTDVAIETADVVLMGHEVAKVDYVLHLAKRAVKVVRQNVAFSIGWMLLLIVIVSTVGIPLSLAVVAHEGSTLLVALNGLRLLRGGPHAPTVPVR